MNAHRKMNVAIDGPAGAGKSTVARKVAKRLSYIYIDTGAMYRAVTWKCLEQGILPEHSGEVVRMAQKLVISLLPGEEGQRVFVDGEEVTEQIRTAIVNQFVSQVAQIAEIRELLVHKQKAMASAKGVVMDGRDIGTKVIPDADVKIYLTASVEERAERRFKEITGKGQNITLEQLKKDIALRDMKDQQREHSPLTQADDAIFIDSSHLSISQVVDCIIEICKEQMDGET